MADAVWAVSGKTTTLLFDRTGSKDPRQELINLQIKESDQHKPLILQTGNSKGTAGELKWNYAYSVPYLQGRVV